LKAKCSQLTNKNDETTFLFCYRCHQPSAISHQLSAISHQHKAFFVLAESCLLKAGF